MIRKQPPARPKMAHPATEKRSPSPAPSTWLAPDPLCDPRPHAPDEASCLLDTWFPSGGPY